MNDFKNALGIFNILYVYGLIVRYDKLLDPVFQLNFENLMKYYNYYLHNFFD